MGVHDIRDLSLGQWTAICRGWNRVHSDNVDPPSVEEFEAAMSSNWVH